MKAEHHNFILTILPPAPVEQSSAPRATLRLSLGAGVTPAARRAGDYFFAYFLGSALFDTFAISCANRAAILLSPLRSAIFIPSSNSLSARGISPLPRNTPTLRKIRA